MAVRDLAFRSGIVCLLTDFSSREAFVGVMKGVVYSVFPEARIVDLTHEIPPRCIVKGAVELRASYRFFPEGTVFVAVVDPGVGSGRRAIAACSGGRLFVAPDNGILSPVLLENGDSEVRVLENPSFFMPKISATFHGRDVFAPAGAKLAAGALLEEVGRPADGFVRLDLPEPERSGGAVTGRFLYADAFGNLITNVPADMLRGLEGGRISFGGFSVRGLSSCYMEGAGKEFCAVVNGEGFLEIASFGASAADRLGRFENMTVTIEG